MRPQDSRNGQSGDYWIEDRKLEAGGRCCFCPGSRLSAFRLGSPAAHRLTPVPFAGADAKPSARSGARVRCQQARRAPRG